MPPSTDRRGTNNIYVYGFDLISVTDGTGAQSYFLYDGLGSVVDTTDGSGNVVSTLGYDVVKGSQNVIHHPFQFPGIKGKSGLECGVIE